MSTGEKMRMNGPAGENEQGSCPQKNKDVAPVAEASENHPDDKAFVFRPEQGIFVQVIPELGEIGNVAALYEEKNAKENGKKVKQIFKADVSFLFNQVQEPSWKQGKKQNQAYGWCVKPEAKDEGLQHILCSLQAFAGRRAQNVIKKYPEYAENGHAGQVKPQGDFQI